MVDRQDAALGFGLVCFAGASTGIGAAIVFSRRLVQLANKRFLAGALGIAAGVMLYVSLIEIFVKANGAFEDAGHSEQMAYFLTTLAFFSGVLFNFLLDKFVHYLEGAGASIPAHYEDRVERVPHSASHPHHHHPHPQAPQHTPPRLHAIRDGDAMTVDTDEADPAALTELMESLQEGHGHSHSHSHSHEVGPGPDDEEGRRPMDPTEVELVVGDGRAAGPLGGVKMGQEPKTMDEDDKLTRMGMMTAIAIGIHNFPEGLATFVATLDDPAVGLSLAVAIAIHNVPEGICVAVPIYYASGNRWKAFAWAALSGVSEILGAALGWVILANTFDDNIYGILFGLVAGIMVHIVIHELIPTALRYDPDDKVVTHTVFIGAAIMALSLVLFVVA